MEEQPQSRLLALPGELRNMIYTFVAASTPTLNIYKGDLIPPPLANTCRQIRHELSGSDWYTKELTLTHTIPITAHLTNFDFTLLYKWLAENDNRPASQKKVLRVLDIELALVSPSSATPGFAQSSLASWADIHIYGEDPIWNRKTKTALATDKKAIFSCDANWVRTLDTDLVTLGRATYGMDKTTRANNQNIYTPTGHRRRFAQTVAGNAYLTSCSTRVSYLHHPRVPVLKSSNDPNTTTPKIAHKPFIHSHDYFAHLTALLFPNPPSISQLCSHALCVRQFRRRIYVSLVKSQQKSQKLKWDRKYYSSLSPEAKRVVRFYRLVDPLPKARLNPLAAAFGRAVVVTGGKRKVGEVYASGTGFGMVEGVFVDRAWVGCEKRRFGSARGDRVVLGVKGGNAGSYAGGGAAAAATSEVEDFGDKMLIDDVVAGLMGRLRLGAR
jgi:hypothetical protein